MGRAPGREPLRVLGLGLGTALAVSLPAALFAQALDAALDDELPLLVTGPLALLVLAGPLAGGWVAAARRLLAAVVGAVALGLVVALGVARDAAADDDGEVTAIPVAMAAGAMLGAAGSTLGARRAGRTRR